MSKCELCNINNKKFDIIYEDNDFSIVFDNYGVHYSHILIIPKIHKLNMCGTNKSFVEFIKKIYNFYKNYFNCIPIIYEHGNVSENLTKNPSIDHAHIHIIADFSDNTKNSFIKDVSYNVIKFDQFYMNDVKNAYHAISDDLLYMYVIEEKLASQQFRKIYALSNSQRYWDWRTNYKEIKEYNLNKHNEKEKLKEALGEFLYEN